MDSEKSAKIFFISIGIFKNLGNKETSRKLTLVGTRYQGAPGKPGVPRWVVPTWDTSWTPFSYRMLVLQDKKIYIYFLNLLITVSRRKSSVLFSLLFSIRFHLPWHLQAPPRTSSSRTSSTHIWRRWCSTLRSSRCMRGCFTSAMCPVPRGHEPWRPGLKLCSKTSSGAMGWWSVDSTPITL